MNRLLFIPSERLWQLKCAKFIFDQGSVYDPAGGAPDAPPDAPSWMGRDKPPPNGELVPPRGDSRTQWTGDTPSLFPTFSTPTALRPDPPPPTTPLPLQPVLTGRGHTVIGIGMLILSDQWNSMKRPWQVLMPPQLTTLLYSATINNAEQSSNQPKNTCKTNYWGWKMASKKPGFLDLKNP